MAELSTARNESGTDRLSINKDISDAPPVYRRRLPCFAGRVQPENAANPAQDKVAGVLDAAVPDANPAATVPIPSNEASTDDYVAKAAVIELFAIESSRLAEQQRTSNLKVRIFAAMMVKAHGNITQGLKTALSQSREAAPLPATLPLDPQAKLETPKQATATDFDHRYLETQVDAHQDALDLHSGYANAGASPALHTFAIQTAPAMQEQLDRARALRDSLPQP